MVQMLEVIEAKPDQVNAIRELFLEYANSLEFDLGFQGFQSEIDSLPGNYSAPKGCVLLALKNSELAGCVALKPIDEEICEMKRLFVRPKFQGHGIGRTLVQKILKRAADMGYGKIRLDTVPSMRAAIEMYRAFGFYSIPAYRENPVPGTSYLERTLRLK